MMLLRHSKGLSLLFFTEMWERFSFYLLRALLVLYMVAKTTDGGLGWTRKEALSLYGFYIGIAYITPIIGGFLSDRYLGQQRSAMIGALLMAIGHFFMAFHELLFFYSALTLVAIGNGFFKPCLTSILGELYNDSSESQRDSAYSLFYMGINIGGMLAGLIGGWLLETFGFSVGFTTAGGGMLLATLIFWWGKSRFLGTVGVTPQVRLESPEPKALTLQEKERLGILLFLSVVVAFFIMAWEQMGGLITLYIQEHVDRGFYNWTIPTLWLANLDPLFIVFFAPLFSLLWTKLETKGLDPFIGTKMGIGCLLLAGSFIILSFITRTFLDNGENPHWSWIVINKLLVVFGELCVLPISWAAVTKLSPQSSVTTAMGVMLAAIGVGSYFAGLIGGLVDELGELAIFDGLTLLLCLLSAVCLMINKTLKRLSS